MLILITLFFTIIFIYSENGIILTKLTVFWGVLFNIAESVIDAEKDKRDIDFIRFEICLLPVFMLGRE